MSKQNKINRKKPVHLVLDADKWICGSAFYGDAIVGEKRMGSGDTQLLNEEGYQCCLGQWLEQQGVEHLALLKESMPDQLLGEDAKNWFSTHPRFCKEAVQYNDTLIHPNTVAERVKQLKALCALEGIKLSAVNFKPETEVQND